MALHFSVPGGINGSYNTYCGGCKKMIAVGEKDIALCLEQNRLHKEKRNGEG